MLAASAVFILLAALALAYGWGVIGVWIALDVLIAARLALLGPRFVEPPLGGRRLDLDCRAMEGLAELHTHLGGSVSSDILWSLAHGRASRFRSRTTGTSTGS